MADGDSATGLIPVATESKRPRQRSEEAFDPDLEFLLVMGDAEMGERGTLGGTIAQLEHGGPFTGVPNTDLYDDQQIGWGNTVIGSVERHRWLSAAWSTLPKPVRFRLDLWYKAPPAQFRSDEGFGAKAKDACPSVEAITKYGAVEPQKPTGFHARKGTEARLGRAAALAFHLCDDPAKLLVACQDPNKGKSGRVIGAALKLAEDAAKGDHAAWRTAKDEAKKPRRVGERRALLPEYDPAKAEQ
jgi:hypothetical protein